MAGFIKESTGRFKVLELKIKKKKKWFYMQSEQGEGLMLKAYGVILWVEWECFPDLNFISGVPQALTKLGANGSKSNKVEGLCSFLLK